MKHKSNEQKRLSQDSLFNLHEIAYDLPQFVWFIQTYPDLLCICGIQEILDQLDRILLIDSSFPQLLSYDTTFKLGDFYVSTLLFRHVIFKESPVIPALFLIHERRFQSTHEIFFQIAIKKVPSLVKKSTQLSLMRKRQSTMLFQAYCQMLKEYVVGTISFEELDTHLLLKFLALRLRGSFQIYEISFTDHLFKNLQQDTKNCHVTGVKQSVIITITIFTRKLPNLLEDGYWRSKAFTALSAELVTINPKVLML